VHVTRALSENGYPLSLVRKQISRRGRPAKPKRVFGATVVLDYLPKLSEKLGRLLASFGIRATFRSRHKLGSLLSALKPQRSPAERTNCVYRVHCSRFSQPTAYVGKTVRSWGTRRRVHATSIESGNREASALAQHAIDYKCAFDLSNVSFLESDDNETKLLKKESIAILKSPNLVNRNSGVGICKAWTSCLSLISYRKRLS